MRTSAAAVSLFALAATATTAHAGADFLIANFTTSFTGNTTALPTWQPYLSYGDPSLPGAVIMNNATLDLADVANGTQFTLTGDFAAFAGLITNASNEAIYLGINVPGGTGSQILTAELPLFQSAFFVAPGAGNPDLSPYTLTRIVILGSSYQGTGGSGFEVGVDFSFYGIPAPSTAIAMLAPIGAMSMRRRR